MNPTTNKETLTINTTRVLELRHLGDEDTFATWAESPGLQDGEIVRVQAPANISREDLATALSRMAQAVETGWAWPVEANPTTRKPLVL